MTCKHGRTSVVCPDCDAEVIERNQRMTPDIEALARAENERLSSNIRAMSANWRKEVDALQGDLAAARAERDELIRYAGHLRTPMCEHLKHSEYSCTCGLSALLAKERA